MADCLCGAPTKGAFHLRFDPLRRAAADAQLAGNLQHAFAEAQLVLDAFAEQRGWEVVEHYSDAGIMQLLTDRKLTNENAPLICKGFWRQL